MKSEKKTIEFTAQRPPLQAGVSASNHSGKHDVHGNAGRGVCFVDADNNGVCDNCGNGGGQHHGWD